MTPDTAQPATAPGGPGSRGGARRPRLILPFAAPLGHRDFRLLWLGAAASLVGDGAYLVALAWQAYTLDGRPSGLALLGVCATVPQLLALLVGGVISDTLERRTVLLWADVVRGAAVGAVAALVLTGQVRMWHLAALSIVYGLGAGIAAPAFDAIIPELVPGDQLEQANALEQFLRPAMLRLAGPGLGGLVVATAGAGTSFLLNAVSFLLSAACLAAMSPTARSAGVAAEAAPAPEASLIGEALAGFSFVRQRVWLWGTFSAATVTYLLFIGPTEVLLPHMIRDDLGGSARDLGLVLAAGGVGAIGAAALVAATGLPRRQLTFMYLTWTVATLAISGYGLSTASWQLGLTCLAVNALEAAGTVAWATTKQRLVPGHLMGRVSSLDWLISIAGLPISYALTAPAAALFGDRPTLIGAGVTGAAVTLGALFLPGMRAVDGALGTVEEPIAAQADRGPAGGETDVHEIARSALQRLSRAFERNDLEGLLEQFSHEGTATYAGSEKEEIATGAPALRALLGAVLARPERYRFDFPEPLARALGSLIWVLADGTGHEIDGSGAAEAFPYRVSGLLVKEPDGWHWALLSGSEPTGPEQAHAGATVPGPRPEVRAGG